MANDEASSSSFTSSMGESSSHQEPPPSSSSSASSDCTKPPAGDSAPDRPRTPASPLAMEPSNGAGEPFHCGICLELVYKPIVQSCGHIFCFWCVHRAMNIRRQSHCPVCRRPYIFFPRVCEQLHFMLMKALPEEYERRSQETHDMEAETQIFSPRFVESPRHVWSPRMRQEEVDRLKNHQQPKWSAVRSSKEQSSALPHRFDTDQTDVASNQAICSSNPERSSSDQEKETHLEKGKLKDTQGMQNMLTVEDFLCSICHTLLYRPIVLNCGEVFCKSCLKGTPRTSPCCPSCGDPRRGRSVHVCLEFHQYLERAFPIDYLKRKEEITPEQLREECESGDTEVVGEGGSDGHLHVGFGCDACGMFPIVGDRYQCQDCTEKVGYDLCGACYRKGVGLSGRFNQQHTSSHRMEEVRVGSPQHLVLNMGNGIIRRRRQQQQLVGDLDDYIDSFIE